MIIGTAGHIDHGKTTLVKALTGVDADRLPEEKARGITLDLGYAYAPLPGADGEDGVLGFIDVPGHERLVHNMLAGATGIDHLLLVVAADDGPMPQTREHFAIAGLLGLTRGCVALTKVDRVTPERLAAARAEVAALLAGSPMADAPLFEVSGHTGLGVAALRAHLDAQALALRQAADERPFRLAIDRCFTLQGVGTVVTGTVFSGEVREGDAVVLSPPGMPLRVRGLRAQDRPAAVGRCGQRCALNLAGPDFDRSRVQRGHWVLAPQAHVPLRRFAVSLRALPGETLKHWMPVHAHLGAADVTGRLSLLEGDSLSADDRAQGGALAELVLDKEVGCVWGDRFILRDQSASRTLGGGTVLDIFPPARHKRAPARLAYLRALAAGDLAGALHLALAHSPGGVDLDRFARNANLGPATARALWAGAAMRVVEAAGGRTGLGDATWQALTERLPAVLAEEHERAPDMIGVERERLRRMLMPGLERPVFNAVLEDGLAQGRVAQTGAWLHRPDHRVALNADDRRLWDAMRPLLDAQPYNPPRVRDLARATAVPEAQVRALMKRVSRTGALYPVAHDHYFLSAAVAHMAAMVAELHATHGAAEAAPFRDRIGTGRKVAIHILEFFDRVGYTRRVKDVHVVREGRGWGGSE